MWARRYAEYFPWVITHKPAPKEQFFVTRSSIHFLKMLPMVDDDRILDGFVAVVEASVLPETELLEVLRDNEVKKSAGAVFRLECMTDLRKVDVGDEDLDALIRLSSGECMNVSVVGLNRAGSVGGGM